MATRPPVIALPSSSLPYGGASSIVKPVTSASDSSKGPAKKLVGHRSQVRSVAWNADGRRLASGSTDKSLRVWQPEKDPRSSVEYKGHIAEVSQVRWNPTHPERLASCSAALADKSLYFWDMRQGGRPTSTIEVEPESINMTWSPDGKYIVLGNKRDVVSQVDVESQKVIKKQEMSREANESAFSHNGKLLLTTDAGYVNINAFPSGEKVHQVQVSCAPATVLDLDARGRYLAAGSNDATVTLWETQEWTCVASQGGHENPALCCRFSHDGQYIASSCGNEIIISEVPSLRKANTITAIGSVDSLAWHPTRNILAYASEDLEGGRPSGAIRLWGM